MYSITWLIIINFKNQKHLKLFDNSDTATGTYNPKNENIINTLRPRQNGRNFPDDIFKCIFLNENAWISIKISMKFVPGGPSNNFPALIQMMAWHRPGDKPLSELMMVSLLRHICVTRRQWVNIINNNPNDTTNYIDDIFGPWDTLSTDDKFIRLIIFMDVAPNRHNACIFLNGPFGKRILEF